MPETVTVALLGNPDRAFENDAFTWHERGAKELDQSWRALPKVALGVEPTETVLEILKQALRESGIRLPHHVDPDDPPISWVMLYVDEVKPAWQHFRSQLTIVDEAGRATWSVPYEDVTFETLVRSAAAGTVPGDPRRLYLILLPPQGMACSLRGRRCSRACGAQHVLEAMATAGGAIAFAKSVLTLARGRLGEGREALQESYLDWTERGAGPNNFNEMLAVGPWHGADLAERLACSEPEAEAVLWAYGHAPDSHGARTRTKPPPS